MLEAAGHTVYGEMFNAVNPALRHVDVVIFLEVMDARWLPYGKQNWLIPNSEWWFRCWDFQLTRIHKVLCKTNHCYTLWQPKVGEKRLVFLGWESEDICNEDIPRKPTFLHFAGKSQTKNTEAVLEAWRLGVAAQLTLVSATVKPQDIPNVTFLQRVTKAERAQLFNENLFHICPSQYEGWGHYIWEAMGCGGIVLTLDQPPMNDFVPNTAFLLPPAGVKKTQCLAAMHTVSPRAL